MWCFKAFTSQYTRVITVISPMCKVPAVLTLLSHLAPVVHSPFSTVLSSYFCQMLSVSFLESFHFMMLSQRNRFSLDIYTTTLSCVWGDAHCHGSESRGTSCFFRLQLLNFQSLNFEMCVARTTLHTVGRSAYRLMTNYYKVCCRKGVKFCLPQVEETTRV